MSTTYYEYRVRCTTDGIDETWILSEDDPVPTTCPTNTAHQIDATQTVIIREISDNVVTVKEESIATGGNFQATTLSFNAIKNQITSASLMWPFPVSALAIEFIAEETNRGDVLDMVIGKNTIIGIITASVSVATVWSAQNYTVGQVVLYNSKVYTCIVDTVSNEVPTNTTYWKYGLELSVNQTVIDNIRIGFFVKLFDGSNQDDVERVLSIDKINNKIYVETNVVNSFSAATPTYVQQSVKVMKDYEISGPWQHIVGSNKIGASYIPANVPVTIDYNNKSIDTDKIVVGQVEYLY